jgi:hypothetical protein
MIISVEKQEKIVSLYKIYVFHTNKHTLGIAEKNTIERFCTLLITNIQLL